jgi:hypothetical protein
MREIGVFMQSVISHWVAWGTGSLLVLVAFTLEKTLGWTIPKYACVAFLAAGFLVSCFQAWSDQFTENEAGRAIGSLALERIEFFGTMASPGARKADVQLTLVLRNIQPRLMECHIDKIAAEIQGKHPGDEYINKGGYIYGEREISLELPFIKGTDILPTVIGEIEYGISYHIVGSDVQHRTSKKLRFTSYPGKKTDYSVIMEDEQ